ncbi:tRNA uridine-5-carboxymethylaminomethyl(34) synthesis GTPase MnmE [bacterium]|nr:tRNA uridine-5-carboxymethylaminomethyl(34) synthesis GTPase MnmE [bacterium]
MNSFNDTIAAIATPDGTGALGVVRLTGAQSLNIASQMVAPSGKMLPIKPQFASLFGIIDGDGDLIDQAVVLYWKSPRSFTGEDMVEFSCHGGREVLRAVYTRLLELGARAAEAGEFTRRAFLNGKMSLDQTEAVAALIESRTRSAVKVSARILDGGLRSKIEAIRQELIDIISRIELALDFVEEELDHEFAKVTLPGLEELNKTVDEYIRQYESGKFLRNGANVVIAGPPNAGKSTLMNTLAGFERAIVSDTPGTTRDFIDVTLDWNGIPIRLYDTAGLREAIDEIEKVGTLKTRQLFEHADVVVWLMSPPGFEKPDHELGKFNNLITVANKSDLFEDILIDPVADLTISAKYHDGVEELQNLVTRFLLKDYDPGDLLVLEQRQASLLQQASDLIRSGSINLETNLGLELVVTDLRSALNLIGEITGAVSSQDILHAIFSRFCIGK